MKQKRSEEKNEFFLKVRAFRSSGTLFMLFMCLYVAKSCTSVSNCAFACVWVLFKTACVEGPPLVSVYDIPGANAIQSGE